MNMRKKVVNTIYICALFFDLSYLCIPVLPVMLHYCALLLFVVYLFLAGIKINNAYKNWTLAYISFFLLSALWALRPLLSIYVVVANILPILIMVFSTITYIKKNLSINKILLVIYIAALLMLSYLASHMDEFLVGVRLGDSLNDDEDKPIWNSNGMGVELCFAIFVGFILFINQKRHLLLRFGYYISAIVMIIAIFLTGSRKSLLILLIPVIYFLYKKKKRYLLPSLLLSSVIGLLLYKLIMDVEIFHEAIGVRIEEMIAIMSGDTYGNEDTSRTILINFGLSKFLNNPILGVGINNFRVLADEIYPGRNYYSHNNYVELLVGVGLIGTLIYYSAYFYIFTRLRKYTDTLSIWGKVFLLILLFLGFVEVLYYEPFEQLMFCILFCIVEYNKKQISLINGYKNKRC